MFLCVCAGVGVAAVGGYSATWMRVTFMALARVSWWAGVCSPMATAKVLTQVALSNVAATSAARVSVD